MVYFKRKKYIYGKIRKYIIMSFILIIFIVLSIYISKIKINSNLINYSLYNIKYDYKDLFLKYNLINKREDNTIPVIKEKSDKPIVYIYNTHQSEEYKLDNNNAYNINPTVLTVSYMLEELLYGYGIDSIVENTNIIKELQDNNLSYDKSYEISKKLINEAKKAYPSLSYFIDIHRDSSQYSKTVIEKNNIKYAKLLFVVGKEHDNYKLNLENTEKLKDYFKDYDYLIRGIYEKGGQNVNGIYNQDNSPNTFLIEVGGTDNYLDECYNTVKILAKEMSEYIKDTYEKEE